MNELDVVYALGTGSLYQNRELHYSLKSLRKYAPDIGQVYVVGAHPGAVVTDKSFIHIPAEDQGKNKEDSIRLKIERACEIPELSDNFLFVNDDHFFTKPLPENYPYYYDQTVVRAHQLKRKNGSYKLSLQNTYEVLGLHDKRNRYFDVHTPIRYNKKLFPSVMREYNWNKFCGYVLKSLYCNTLGIEGTAMEDLKIFQQYETIEELNEAIGDRHVFSIDDMAVNQVLWEKLDSL